MEVSQAMKEQYFLRRLNDYSTCLSAIVNKEASLIERIGHQIKGNSASYGFDGLQEIGAGLEQAALSKNWEEMKIFVEKLGSYLSKRQ